jgi:hypothetical protein
VDSRTIRLRKMDGTFMRDQRGCVPTSTPGLWIYGAVCICDPCDEDGLLLEECVHQHTRWAVTADAGAVVLSNNWTRVEVDYIVEQLGTLGVDFTADFADLRDACATPALRDRVRQIMKATWLLGLDEQMYANEGSSTRTNDAQEGTR